jgi:heptosyltransferase I
MAALTATLPDAPLDRVAIVMLSALGDAVHVLPLLTALKRHRPSAQITWVTQPAAASLVRGHRALDRLVVFDRDRGLAAFGDVRRAVTGAPFDLLLDLQVYFKAGLLTALIPARTKLGFDRTRARDLNWLFTNAKLPPRPGPRHVQDQYLEFLAAIGVPAEPLRWDLGPWAGETVWRPPAGGAGDQPYAALVIGSSRRQKDWLADRWADVADALFHDHGLRPVLVGGTSPREQLTATIIKARARAPVVDALGSGLRPLVSILHGAELVVSLDTGPLHMAVALERPVVSLIGYNDPRIVGPYRHSGDLVVSAYDAPVARDERMRTITVDAVLAAVARWRDGHRTATG